jgi:methyltransferase, FkbM family
MFKLLPFFDFMTRLGRKHSFLKENIFGRYLKSFYRRIKMYVVLKNTTAFYAANANRVEAVANMLADEQSKTVYLSMIKFRQSLCLKDFPLYNNKELPQYFIKEVKYKEGEEFFIDCGAFDGDTIDGFMKYCPEYKRIVAFEPNTELFAKLQEKYGSNPKITLINAGVYDADGEIRFAELKGGMSRIGDEDYNTVNIPIKAIDGLNFHGSSFIKMDIEGAEFNALKGAEKTILQNKPKLAICIYHSNEDMLRIAEYIHALVPEYKLYVRHHTSTPSASETVLYALMP